MLLFRALGGALPITARQPIRDAFECPSKRFKIENLGIVVAAANGTVDHGVKSRDKPLAGADACNRVQQRQLPVLRRSESGIGRGDIIGTASGPATARLDQLDMEKQSLEGFTEEQRPLELRRTPGHAEIMAEKYASLAVDERVGEFEGVRAAKPR